MVEYDSITKNLLEVSSDIIIKTLNYIFDEKIDINHTA